MEWNTSGLGRLWGWGGRVGALSGASPFPQLAAGENENEIAALEQQVH